MSSTGACGRGCIAPSSCSSHVSVKPPCSEAKLARWIVAPSAIGSLNGTPISTTSASLEIARRLSAKPARSGKPAVMKPTSAGRPLAAAALIAALMLSRGCAELELVIRAFP